MNRSHQTSCGTSIDVKGFRHDQMSYGTSIDGRGCSIACFSTCRWAEDEAAVSSECAEKQAAKKAKAAQTTAPKAKEKTAASDQEEPAEAFDGLTSGLDGLLESKSGKGKSGPASIASSGKVRALGSSEMTCPSARMADCLASAGI